MSDFSKQMDKIFNDDYFDLKKAKAALTDLIIKTIEEEAPDKDYRYDRIDDFNEAVNEYKSALIKAIKGDE